MAKLIIVPSSLSDKIENSNEGQTLLQRHHLFYLFISCNWFSESSSPVSVDPRFKPLKLNVTSVISSNPTRSCG